MQKPARFIGLAIAALVVVASISGCDWWRKLTAPETNDPGNPPPGTNHAPISSIVLPYAAQAAQPVTVQNLATDEDGDAVIAYRFRSSVHDLTQANKVATLTFPSIGQYTVAVSAKDSHDAWGPEVSATITITVNPPPSSRLFYDDGTLEPVDLGYQIGFPANGDFSIVTAGGTRTMRYENGNKSGSFHLNDYMSVPRGTRLKFRINFYVDADPVWLSAGSSRGYALLHLILTNDDHSRHGNYFVLATRDLDSDGFPGSPPRFESNFQPGRDAYIRVGNGWTTMDIDLDELARTKFSSASGFTKIWFSHTVLTYPSGEPPKYRLAYTLDSFEVYVPSAP